MADYSADVEIDENGILVAVRDLEKGETISVPPHMFGRTAHRSLKLHTISTSVSIDEWRNLWRSD